MSCILLKVYYFYEYFLSICTKRHTSIQYSPLHIQYYLFCSCCGAGTAADTEMTTQMISSQLELHRLTTNRTPRVCTANRLLKQMLFR